MKFHTSHYTFFDTILEFKTNYPASHREFNRIYGYFASSRQRPQINCLIEKLNNSFNIKAKSKYYSLKYKINEEPSPFVYLSLFSPVIYTVRDYFLIHAGSLCTPSGESVIISAPCGFGKTTLTRELLKQGFKLLSDELAPINLKTGLIYPYPRGMGVLSGENKEIIDVPRNAIGNPSRPGFIIFLTLEKVPDEGTIEIAFGKTDDNLIRALKDINGVKEVMPICGRLFPMLRISLQKDTHIVTKLHEICNKNDIPIIYTLRGISQPPDFNAEPKLNEISPKEGIFELSKNILNAHNSVLLEETFSGKRTKMVFELAGLMDKAVFFTLTVGKLHEMIKLVCRL